MIHSILAMFFFLPLFQTITTLPKEEYLIFDGSGNRYLISQGYGLIIDYDPVTPEKSSSGMYSGGEKVKRTISEAQYLEISQSVHRTVKEKKYHSKDRVKGSFSIAIIKSGKETNYLIAGASEEVKALEALLKLRIQ